MMDAYFGIKGYGHQPRIVLCLDKVPHQLTVLSHIRAVVELCMTHISCDPLEADSLKELEIFDLQLQKIQSKALKAKAGKVKMQALPSILSSEVQANDIDDLVPAPVVESTNLPSAQAGAQRHESEVPPAPSIDLAEAKGGGPDPHEKDSHEKCAEANLELGEQAPKPRTPSAGVEDATRHAAPYASTSAARPSPQPDDLPTVKHQQGVLPAPPRPSSVAGRSWFARMKFTRR